jgi:hypothetical protein
VIKVSVEVREGAARFKVAVQAESISQAVNIVKGRHPDRDVRVVFPIDPERYFPGGPQKAEGTELRSVRAPSARS